MVPLFFAITALLALVQLLHFDMSQCASGAFASSSLFGAPRGYVGSNTYGKLTAALRDAPDAVVLLDEIEKATPTCTRTS